MVVSQDGLAVRASNRLKTEELLVPTLAGTRLRMELDRAPLWRGNHVGIKQLAEDFAKYTYLPRLSDSHVLEVAISDGLGLLLWSHESFAYADSFDEVAERYRGLRCGQQNVVVSADSNDGLVVKPAVALKQQQADESTVKPPVGPGGGDTGEKGSLGGGAGNGGSGGGQPPSPRVLKRFHGAVKLNPERVGRDAGRIAEEVIAHLEGLVGSEVTVTLEIDASIPEGAPDNVVRIVTENSRTLKFTAQGFEES